MKKILIVVGILSMFSFTSHTKINLEKTNTRSVEPISLDCNELAQGFYTFLVNVEDVEPREAGIRARAFRDACEEVN